MSSLSLGLADQSQMQGNGINSVHSPQKHRAGSIGIDPAGFRELSTREPVTVKQSIWCQLERKMLVAL